MKALKKNDVYTVTIDRYSAEGYGIASIEGQLVFVPKALVGETWEIKILKVSASAVYAKAENCLVSSPKRITPQCPHFGRCGGCDTSHMCYEEELRFKLQSINGALRHIGKQSVEARDILGSEQIIRYRNKGIFAVELLDGQPAFGFSRERSHDLIPISDCLLQSELACRAAQAVIAFMRTHHISAYDENSGQGHVRHIFCRSAVKGPDAVACIVSTRGFGADTKALVDALRQACPELTGIVLNINKSAGNTVLSGDFYPLWGNPNIRDTLCGIQFEIAPQAFFQINPPQAEKLYGRAVTYALQNQPSLILDLYCGAGTISLCMAGKAQRVIGAEIVPEAVENAAENARRNGIQNVEFICADAGAAAQELACRGLHPDVIVVDPPRKGLSEAVIEAITLMRPERLVYVSCNPATLSRDILRLQTSAYSLREICAVDMFPRTRHVETVVLLSHKDPDSHIHVKVEFGEGKDKVPLDKIAERAEKYKPKEKVTYKKIKEYIEDKFGFKVHTAYIAEVKRAYGLPMYDAPNAVEELKQPRKHPTEEKVKAISDALVHFGLIDKKLASTFEIAHLSAV